MISGGFATFSSFELTPLSHLSHPERNQNLSSKRTERAMPTPDDKVTPAQQTPAKPLETSDGKTTATATATQTQLDQTTTTNRLQSDTSRPGDKPAGEPYETPAEAFKNATGLENVPANRTDAATKLNDAMTATQAAEGVSPGQQIKYTGANGETITGGEFVNKDGRFFRTAENETYKVEGKPGGGYTLTPVDSAGKPKADVEPFDASVKGRADSGVNGNKPEPMSKPEPLPKNTEQPPTKPENPTPTKPQEINPDAQARAEAARQKVEQAQQYANQKPESGTGTKPEAKPDQPVTPKVEGGSGQPNPNTGVKTTDVTAGGASGSTTRDANYQQGVAAAAEIEARRQAAKNNNPTPGLVNPTDVTGKKPEVTPAGQTTGVKPESLVPGAAGQGGKPDATGGAIKPGDATGSTTAPKVGDTGVGGKPGGTGGTTNPTEMDARSQRALEAQQKVAEAQTRITGGKPTDAQPQNLTSNPGGKPEGQIGNPVPPGQGNKSEQYTQGVAAANEIAARREQARQQNSDSVVSNPQTSGQGDSKGKGVVGDTGTGTKGVTTDATTAGQNPSQYNAFRQSIASNPDLAKMYDGLGQQGQREMQRSFNGLSSDAQSQALKDPSRFLQAAQESGGKDLRSAVRTDVQSNPTTATTGTAPRENLNPAVTKPETPNTKPEGTVTNKPPDGAVTGRPQEVPGGVKPQDNPVPRMQGSDANAGGGSNPARDRAIDQWSKQLNLSDQDKSRLAQLPPDKQADVLRNSMGKPPDQRSEFFQNSLSQAETGRKGGGEVPRPTDGTAKPADTAVKPSDATGSGGPKPQPQNPDVTTGGGKPQGDKQQGQPQPPIGDKGPVVLQQPGQGDRGPNPGNQGDRGPNPGNQGDRGPNPGNQGDRTQGNQFRATPEDNKLIWRNLTDEQRNQFVKDMKTAQGGEARAEVYKNAIEQATANRDSRVASMDGGKALPGGGDQRPGGGVDGKAVADAVRNAGGDRGGDKGGDRGGDAQSKLPPDLAKNYMELKGAVSRGEMSPEQAQKQWKATLESFTQNPDNRQLLEQIRQQRQEQQGGPREVGKDGGKDGIVLQGRVEAQQQAQQQRNEVVLKTLGLDLNNKDNREFLAEALKRLEAVKLGDASKADIKLQDVLKGLDPAKIAKLEALLSLDGTKQGGKQLDANAMTALKDVLSVVAKAPDKMATSADIANAQKTAIEKVLEALKGKPEQVTTGVLQTKDGKGILPELIKTAEALTQNTGRQISVADLIVRTMDTRTPGVQDSRSIFDNRTDVMTAKLTPAQEQAIKNLTEVKAQQTALDATKSGALDPAARRPDAIKLDINPTARPELVGVKPGDIMVGKPGEGIGQIGAQKADALVPGVKADIGVGAKPEAGAVKGDIAGLTPRLDPTTGKPFDSTATTIGATGERGEKIDPMLAELKAQKERDDKRKEKEREEKEKKDKELSEEELNQQRALLALMAARKLKEEQEKEEKERQAEKDKKKDDDTRRRYVVKQGDTLDKIATKECRDVRLSALIYEINREVIPLKEEKGKKVVDLKPKLVIWLPSEADITEFRQRLFGGSRPNDASGAGGTRSDNKPMSAEDELAARFGNNWDGTKEAAEVSDAAAVADDLMSGAMAVAQNRRANIEKLLGPVAQKGNPDGRINYIVRLGDTLKSVASKHPALKDVHLWKLLADANGISTATDSRGNPTSTLTRGSTIVIPSPDEIEKYREGAGKRPSVLSPSSAETKVEKVAKSCPACGRMAVLSARICPACAAPFETNSASADSSSSGPDAASVMLQAMTSLPKAPARKPYMQDATTEQLGNDNGPKTTPVTGPPTGDAVAQAVEAVRTPGEPAPMMARPQGDQVDRFIKSLGEASRLVKSSENWSTAGGRFREQLEVLRGASWEAVVSYEIYEDVSLRHEHTPDGRRKTVRIDLPPMAAQELADNDLFANWQSYCKRYMAQFLES